MKKVTILCALLCATSVQANEHTFPNITDYRNPYVHAIKLPNAQGQLIKAVQKDGGDKEPPSLSITRVEIGVMRERYDNKFANLGVFYAQSDSGEKSFVADEDDAELKSQIGAYYENGVHLGDIDLSAFIEMATADMATDGKSESNIAVGIGVRGMLALHRTVDIGATILFSGHYSGAGLGIKFNF